jgi:uncharacterized membrane protein
MMHHHHHHRGGMTGGYMPSVDEMSILQSTPPQSPKEKRCNSPSLPSAFSFEKSLTEDLSGNACMLQDDVDDVDTEETNDDKQVGEYQVQEQEQTQHSSSSSSTLSSSNSSLSSSSSSSSSSYLNALKSRFTSPPLANVSSSEEISRLVPMRHSRRVLRRNSPPELFFNRFVEQFQSENKRDHQQVALSHHNLDVFVDRRRRQEDDPMFLTTTTSTKTPPSYHDHVTRSTRFTTALPASIVLNKIETILSNNPSPLPYPFQNIPQHLHLDWDQYLLEVRYGGVLTCTIQVFLFQRGVYLVEFRRGQMEIFQFKRFYEDIRESIADMIQEEQVHHHHHHQQTVHLSFRTTTTTTTTEK